MMAYSVAKRTESEYVFFAIDTVQLDYQCGPRLRTRPFAFMAMLDSTPLGSGPIHWFADWPIADLPTTGSAVYTVWNRMGAFVYVGMSGRSAAATGKGPHGRLHSHASGRRSGDQFCIYVCDRLVLPGLHNRLGEIADGSLSLDGETRAYIRAELGFRWLSVSSPAEAFALETSLQRGGWDHGSPMLNPIGTRPPRP